MHHPVGQLYAMAKPRGRSPAPAVTQTPVHEVGRWLYENSVWLQRTVVDAAGRRGLVFEVNVSKLLPGLPNEDDEFTVMFFGADGRLDQSTAKRIRGKELISIKQDSWEVYPPGSLAVNDPDVEFVAAPGAKVGWRITDEEFMNRRGYAKTMRAWLDAKADFTRARINGRNPNKNVIAAMQRVDEQLLKLRVKGTPNFKAPLTKQQQQQPLRWLQDLQELLREQEEEQQQQEQQQEGSSKQGVTKEGACNKAKAELEDKVGGRCYGAPVELYWQRQAAGKQAGKRKAAGAVGQQQQTGEGAGASPKKGAKKARKSSG